MADLGLQDSELLPLIQTLVADLTTQSQQLKALLDGSVDAPTLHRSLHALKGMAGLSAQAALLQAITQADDASRSGDLQLGLELSKPLVGELQAWLDDAHAWLQRYSST
jgi:HPt (histidine-containing phosphotransfer) domain-containing protein